MCIKLKFLFLTVNKSICTFNYMVFSGLLSSSSVLNADLVSPTRAHPRIFVTTSGFERIVDVILHTIFGGSEIQALSVKSIESFLHRACLLQTRQFPAWSSVGPLIFQRFE